MNTLAEIRKNLQSRANLELDFKVQLEDLSRLAAREGIHILPYSENTWPRFRSLDSEKQIETVSHFLLYRSVCMTALEDGSALFDDLSLLWYAIRKMDLRPRSDIFDKISDGDVIEIYDSSFIQVFRNFKFFEICSYSLAEIFIWEWRDLYAREDHVTSKLAEEAISVLTGKADTLEISAGDHFLEEKFGPLGIRMQMTPKYFSPLYDKNNAIPALIATSKVTIVETGLEAKPPTLKLRDMDGP